MMLMRATSADDRKLTAAGKLPESIGIVFHPSDLHPSSVLSTLLRSVTVGKRTSPLANAVIEKIMNTSLDLKTYASDEDLAELTAADIRTRLSAAIAERGSATVAVSGGTSPIPLFQQLSMARLDWQHVTITLVDERWVSPESKESNESVIRKYLLAGNAAVAKFIPLKMVADSPDDALPDVADRLAAMARPFDLVLLGMGMDGHTASWFPDDPEIAGVLASDHACVAARSIAARLPRITLTPKAVLDARLIMLIFSGRQKYEVFERALQPGPQTVLPVRAILHQRMAPVAVHCVPGKAKQ